jgi:hypothetical protein
MFDQDAEHIPELATYEDDGTMTPPVAEAPGTEGY